jgi:hypothetical protein
MAYKYPDKNGNMVETPHLNTFIKGMDEARRHGYSPGLNTVYQAPKSQKVTFAQAQGRLRNEIGSDFVSDPADKAERRFQQAVASAVRTELQAAGIGTSKVDQAPLVARESQAPAAKPQRQGLSWPIASQKLKAELGDHFLDEGAAPLAKSNGLGPRAVRRFHEPMPGCKLVQL